MGLFKKEKDMIRTREQLELFAKRLASVAHDGLAWEESLDGDDTEFLAKEFLKELDELNGNV